jgi:hypothetical protein
MPVTAMTGDGEVVTYLASAPSPGFPGSAPEAWMVSRRGPGAWSLTQPLGPFPSLDHRVLAFGPGYETALIFSAVPESASEGAFYREDRGGAYTEVVRAAGLEDDDLIGASPDLQRLFFGSSAHLLPGDATRTGGGSIYEEDGAELRLVDVAPDGSLLSDCGSSGQAISTDANRLYFITQPGCFGSRRLFLAERGADAREVSASRCTAACGEPGDVNFLSATPSGARALFLSEERLTDEDTNAHLDLYGYDADADQLTLVSNGSGGPDLVPVANPVEWFPRAAESEDGSSVYFTAAEQIGPGETGPAGIYLADGSGIHFLAPTATTELIEVSSDGRYALLSSTAALEAGDTDGQKDVYRYDAVSGAFARVSKGPSGGNGAAAAAVERDTHSMFDATAGGNFRAMSSDGSRIFFVTGERLVPQDDNDAQDVYEWANGDVALISSGAGPVASTFLTSSRDGSSVLFKTADTLLARDRDGNDYDYYVARTGGGFPEPPSVGEPCPCRSPGSSREQIDRSEVASAKPSRRILLAPIGAAERRRIARSGWIELLVEVPAAGRLEAAARARLGRRSRPVAAATAKVSTAGPVRLRMRLSRAAREALGRGAKLSVHLRLSLSRHPEAAAAVTLVLTKPRR